MAKTELIDAIASGVDDLTRARAEQALNVMLQAIMKSADKGDAISLIGFGTFSQSERTEHMAHDPCTGREIKAEIAKTVKFRTDQKFRNAVNA